MTCVMVKSLSHAGAPTCDLGAKQEWKSWSIIVIQVGSGESRISAGGVEPESRFGRTRGLEFRIK